MDGGSARRRPAGRLPMSPKPSEVPCQAWTRIWSARYGASPSCWTSSPSCWRLQPPTLAVVTLGLGQGREARGGAAVGAAHVWSDRGSPPSGGEQVWAAWPHCRRRMASCQDEIAISLSWAPLPHGFGSPCSFPQPHSGPLPGSPSPLLDGPGTATSAPQSLDLAPSVPCTGSRGHEAVVPESAWAVTFPNSVSAAAVADCRHEATPTPWYEAPARTAAIGSWAVSSKARALQAR